jgi:hypothetical protein
MCIIYSSIISSEFGEARVYNSQNVKRKKLSRYVRYQRLSLLLKILLARQCLSLLSSSNNSGYQLINVEAVVHFQFILLQK